jgi:hypothetical protein
MRVPNWMLGMALAATALLSACGGGGSSNNNSGDASVRLLNASIGHSSLDLKRETTAVNSAVAFGSAGSYTAVPTSTSSAQVFAAGGTTVLASPTLSGLVKDTRYTVIAWGEAGAVTPIVLSEGEAAPTTTGKAKILVFNLAAGAGNVDVYMTNATAALADVSPNAAVLSPGRADSYREVDASAYRLRVTAAGSKTDLRLDVPAVTLESQKVYVLMLTSAPGSAMVNALLMPYDAAVTRFENGIAKARVISALPRTSTVTASLNGATVLNNAGSPVVSAYETVTVTNGATLRWTVDGVTQPDRILALARSATYSLLVWGAPATPTLTILTEDNSLPVSGSARLRVLNAVQGLQAVDLYLNLSPVISGVASGQLSNSTTLNAVDEYPVSVRAGATTVFSVSRKFNSGGVYTIYLTGTVGNIEAQIVQQ